MTLQCCCSLNWPVMQTSDLERWIHRDPAGRGILSRCELGTTPCAGHLAAAANELATRAKCVAIVTGFFVRDARTPAAETDGPLGSTLLADVLQSSGVEALVITDQLCASTLKAAMSACRIEVELLVCPIEPEASRQWRNNFWNSLTGRSLTHLVSIERVGPSLHDDHETACCRNIRGIPIDEWSADLYRLFEDHPEHVRTIGIGDGGNEIGLGTFWSDPSQTLKPPHNACRTRTDWTILAGVSDWGAMALATTYAFERNDNALISLWTSDRLEHALTQMVTTGPAIDGCTLQFTPTIDGLPFTTFVQPWEYILTALALDPCHLADRNDF